MQVRPLLFCIAVVLLSPIAVIARAKDTAILSAHLESVRGKVWVPNDEFRGLQTEYLGWIDSRVRAGNSARSMNHELREAGLFPNWAKPEAPHKVDKIYESHAGYLGPILEKPVRHGRNVVTIAAGIYKGSGCSLDVTAVVYERLPFRRLGYINAEPSKPEYAFYLSGLDVGPKSPRGERLIGSGWVASNCTSTWNGKRIRIDRLSGSSIEPVLERSLNARDQEGEHVAARVEGRIVTFRYRGATGDDDLLGVPTIARYQVLGDHVVLASPLALTRAGFIYEWLRISEGDALRWSEPGAAAARASVASSLARHGFKWERIAQCGGSPAIWEIAIRLDEANSIVVFRISGSRATELRMLSLGVATAPPCRPEAISKGLAGVAAELPW
jgi:hypothetical protein